MVFTVCSHKTLLLLLGDDTSLYVMVFRRFGEPGCLRLQGKPVP